MAIIGMTQTCEILIDQMTFSAESLNRIFFSISNLNFSNGESHSDNTRPHHGPMPLPMPAPSSPSLNHTVIDHHVEYQSKILRITAQRRRSIPPLSIFWRRFRRNEVPQLVQSSGGAVHANQLHPRVRLNNQTPRCVNTCLRESTKVNCCRRLRRV